MERFEVWIICTRGTGHSWRKMETLDTRKEAEDLVAWHKRIDAKFPQGHYRYKIETAPAESSASVVRFQVEVFRW